MAVSDAILKRLLDLHPKIIDLTLDRMYRLLEKLGHPERKLPPVIHVAGTNGKGSTIAYLRAILEAAGLNVHAYTSPHLVRFHERIRLGTPGTGALISEDALTALLEECEAANGNDPITFFEITTAAALLAFSRLPADYLLLEVGLGGRLDATNVIDKPAVSVITAIDLDHQQYLGDTIEAIAREKAGVLKPGVPAVVAHQQSDALPTIEAHAARIGAPLMIADQDWQAYEQHGRMVFQDENGLLDLPMPQLAGRFQLHNAGNAVAAIRALNDPRISEVAIAEGLKSASWPARLQRLDRGKLHDLVTEGTELWLDGGHNPSAGQAIAESLADLSERVEKPLFLVLGMLNTKSASSYLEPFAGLVSGIVTVTIPDEHNALSAEDLAAMARGQGIDAEPAGSITEAISTAAEAAEAPRIVICGSLYLAGHVLALHAGKPASSVSGAAKKQN
jgi:dihydrofolate synthase/folylpolyglutamate synthase